MPVISLDPSSPSPYDLPRLVEAQDPPVEDDAGLQELLDDPPVAPASGETPSTEPEDTDTADAADLALESEDPESTVPTSDELVQEIESSPPADWQQYLQPILKDIKNTVQVPIELRNSIMTSPFAGDPDLGFHITGTIVFLDAVPPEYADLPNDTPLRYEAYVSPDGELGTNYIKIFYDSQPETPTPDYRPSNPNVYR